MAGLAADSLRSLLKENLHNDETFTDPGDLNNLLTLGQERIIQDSPHTLGNQDGTITTVADQTTPYDLASDFYKLSKGGIWDASNSLQLEPMPAGLWAGNFKALSTIPGGPPQYYKITFFDSVTDNVWKLEFYPIPDAIITIAYYYYLLPAVISGTTKPAICEIGFSQLLLDAATFIGLKRNDPEGSTQYFRDYLAGLERYESYNPQGAAETHRLRPPVMGGGGTTLRLPPEFPG